MALKFRFSCSRNTLYQSLYKVIHYEIRLKNSNSFLMRNPIKTLNDSAKTYVRHQKIHNTEFHRQLDSSCAHKVLFRLQRIRKNKCIYLIDRLG